MNLQFEQGSVGKAWLYPLVVSWGSLIRAWKTSFRMVYAHCCKLIQAVRWKINQFWGPGVSVPFHTGISTRVSLWIVWASEEHGGYTKSKCPKWQEVETVNFLRSGAGNWHCVTSAILHQLSSHKYKVQGQGTKTPHLFLERVSKTVVAIHVKLYL